MLILQVCEFLDNGDGFYRFHEPSRYLSRLPDVHVIDCDLQHRLLPGLLEMAEVVLLQGFDWDLFPTIERRRAQGKATVLEANDYYYDVQPWNVRASMWLDRGTQEEFRQCMAAVDAVQTSTDELGRRWRPRARQVVVFPNQLTDVPPLPSPPARPLTIGWGGSLGHYADWYHVAPVLEQWLTVHPEVHLAVMTDDLTRSFIHLPPDRYHTTALGSLSDYLKFLWTVDIGLAPLVSSDFNRGRSDVKFLEYASHGVVGIYADLEPYRGSVVAGETGLLYSTPEELHGHLDRLAADASLRLRLRQQAHAHVANKRRLGDHIGKRLEFYQGLMPCPSREFVLPVEVSAAAVVVDGRYLQLRPQQPEQTLQACSQGPARREAAQALAQLVNQYPNYVAALQQLGKSLNDLREASRAEEYLEKALTLQPHSARTMCEWGRTRFLLGDVAGAKRRLEEALTLNPYYQAGWQYLMRLLIHHPQPNGFQWARRAREIHPDNWGLALTAALLVSAEELMAFGHEWLDRYGPGLGDEERPMAAAAYSETLRVLWEKHSATGGWSELLRKSCRLFPESARLADLHWRALSQAGQWPEAYAEQERALAIRRRSQTYNLEYPKEGNERALWQFGGHIRKWSQNGQSGVSGG